MDSITCSSDGPMKTAPSTCSVSARWTTRSPSCRRNPKRAESSSAMATTTTVTTVGARLLPLALAAAALMGLPARAAASAHITVVNTDGPNEGFNDPTPVAPIGGNPGTTKGQQRLIAFQFAADLWGASLDSNIDIQIQASFDPLGANVLGAAGAAFSIRNFNDFAAEGFPGGTANTNYHIALADKRAGVDLLTAFGLTAATPEIVAQFSSDF